MARIVLFGRLGRLHAHPDSARRYSANRFTPTIDFTHIFSLQTSLGHRFRSVWVTGWVTASVGFRLHISVACSRAARPGAPVSYKPGGCADFVARRLEPLGSQQPGTWCGPSRNKDLHRATASAATANITPPRSGRPRSAAPVPAMRMPFTLTVTRPFVGVMSMGCSGPGTFIGLLVMNFRS